MSRTHRFDLLPSLPGLGNDAADVFLAGGSDYCWGTRRGSRPVTPGLHNPSCGVGWGTQVRNPFGYDIVNLMGSFSSPRADRSPPWATATRHLPAPLAVVEMDAFEANVVDVRRRGAGTPIRIATKSLRVPRLLGRLVQLEGIIGLMAYSLAEALWLVENNISTNILIAYPTVSMTQLQRLGDDARARQAITLMVDNPTHLEMLTQIPRRGETPFSVCIDVDASLRVGPVHIGVRRSPIKTPTQAAHLAQKATQMGITVWGVMMYEAQVAGVNETGFQAPIVRRMKRLSLRTLATKRAQVLEAVESVVGHKIHLNGGGSGSVNDTASDPMVTEVAAGSGLFVPTLFDHYRSFHPRPAAFFGLDVVRHPGRGLATLFGGGYVASGPPGVDRLPQPRKGRYLSTEAAGEVQTPLRFRSDQRPEIGQRVWFRHAKAGELMEHFTHVHLVRASTPDARQPIETLPTYRGEGLAFG